MSKLPRALTSLALLLAAGNAHAIAHPHHEHEDLLNERDLLMGFKGGPQTTSFTQYTANGANIVPQSRMRFVAGGAVKFVYDLPRIEFDFLWSARGWVNTENTVNFLAVPVIVKFPMVTDKGVEFEIGPGVQPELTIFGADPHNYSMFGALISAGFSLDRESYVIDIDLRYVYDFTQVSDAYPGTKTRDLQAMCGVLWHF